MKKYAVGLLAALVSAGLTLTACGAVRPGGSVEASSPENRGSATQAAVGTQSADGVESGRENGPADSAGYWEGKKKELREAKNVRIGGHCYTYIKYAVNDDSTLRLISLKTEEDTLVIPARIKDLPVVCVGALDDELSAIDDARRPKMAWIGEKNEKIKKLVIQEGVERILPGTFKKLPVGEVDLPGSMVEVGKGAFSGEVIKKKGGDSDQG